MMKVNKRIISASHDVMKTPLQKAIGLMFQSRVKKPLVFPFHKDQRISLHMMFVFMPIDLIFLNSSRQVIETKENFLPFTFYTSKKKARYLIEAEQDTIARHHIKLGQTISF